MKRILLLTFLLLPAWMMAQITTATVKAYFGVDGELRANYMGSSVQTSDDWFRNASGTGIQVIDTNGAYARMQRYATDVAYRRLPFSAGMSLPQFTVSNNRLLYDAYYYRDYHGDDSTIFASGSNKNGMSPADWSTPIAQSVPDKNEILETMMHIRRAGPYTTDSLWMFGGVSIENTTGSRYFDFELWQTDITYNRAGLNFTGYGPDAGHTSWKFDGSGNVTQVGDIIFTAEFSSSSLSFIEARLWVNINDVTANPNPANFTWGPNFDGASLGSIYGYKSITPKTAGAFYSGLQSANNTWPGPFGLIIGSNAMQTNYTSGQFMEFSVNLTKIGLDPVMAQLGGNACGLPFKKVFIKSRASTSFTAALKDFVLPFKFFAAPKATVQATVPKFCGSSGVTDISVTNPLITSTYSWVTSDGRIVGTNSGTTITADTTGTYIVQQQLLASCPAYATDTIIITADPLCTTLGCDILNFSANLNKGTAQLNWQAVCRQAVDYFEVERSVDGIHFEYINHINNNGVLNTVSDYAYTDYLNNINAPYVYYRLRATGEYGKIKYSQVIKISLTKSISAKIMLTPNPVSSVMLAYVESNVADNIHINVFSSEGKLLKTKSAALHKGQNTISIDGFEDLPRGIYHIIINTAGNTYSEKIMVNN